jgi:starch synthase
VYAKHVEQEPAADKTRYVLSIHNLEHQGIVDASMLDTLGIPGSFFHPDGIEFYGKINVLKGGILSADAVTTVSSQYARDIQTQAHGHGLEGVVAFHAANLTGIGNGIDISIWNPATDPALVSRFDAEDCAGKILCKAASLTDLRLDLVTERPLLTLAQNLDARSGFAAFMDCLHPLMKSDVSVIVLGAGDPELERRLRNAVTTFPGRVAWVENADGATVRRCLAASDFALIPAPYEASGSLHQGAQRYGCVPIAHAAGGNLDAIVDCDAQLETGTGFLFDAPDATSILGGVQRALASHQSPRFASLRRRVMRLDVGWDRPAFRYEVLYRSLLA